MNAERDKFIVEWFGEKWHDIIFQDGSSFHIKGTELYKCSCTEVGWQIVGFKEISKKALIEKHNNPDLSTAEGFQKVWKWMIHRDYFWYKFSQWLIWKDILLVELIGSPEKFADAVGGFLRSEVKE